MAVARPLTKDDERLLEKLGEAERTHAKQGEALRACAAPHTVHCAQALADGWTAAGPKSDAPIHGRFLYDVRGRTRAR